MFIFMEYCSGGTLREEYLRRKQGLPLAEGRRYTAGILAGLQHLHDHQIAHRDLKCPGRPLDQICHEGAS